MNHYETEWINSFKGIAALGVILVHFSRRSIENELFTQVVSTGAMGVQIFLIISSYLIFLSLNKNNIHGMNPSFKWIAGKLLRLMPLYYIALIVYLVTFGLGNSYWLGSVPNVSILNIICHFLFLHGLYPYYFNNIIGVEWYLGVIFMLYLIAPLLYKYISNFTRALCVFLISLIACNYIHHLENLPVIADQYIWEHFITKYNIIAQFAVIASGIVLFYLLNSVTVKKAKNNKPLSYCLLFFSVFVIYRLMKGSTFYGLSLLGLWGIAFCILILSQVIYKNKLVCNRLFEFIGKYSYGIYLFHYLFIQKLPEIPLKNIYISWIVNYSVILLLSLGLSVILHHLIEKPFLKLCRGR